MSFRLLLKLHFEVEFRAVTLTYVVVCVKVLLPGSHILAEGGRHELDPYPNGSRPYPGRYRPGHDLAK